MLLFAELKRRNVFRVAVAYLVFAWLVLQVADVVFPALSLPEWTITLVTVLLAIGFVAALAFSWAFELTPEGVKREGSRRTAAGPGTGRKLDIITIAMLALILVVVVVDRSLDRSTTEAVAQAASAPSAEAEAPTAEAAPETVSIAVLPFDDMSDTQDQEYFGDGIAEELLNRLAKIEDFRVAGRTSSFASSVSDSRKPKCCLRRRKCWGCGISTMTRSRSRDSRRDYGRRFWLPGVISFP